MTNDNDRTELAAQTAKLGAVLAAKGLTPDEVAALMRDQVQPVLDEAVRRAESGEDVSNLQFEVRHSISGTD